MGNSIVFVDWRVADIDSLIAGLPSDFEIVILDSASDGLDQIATRLQGRSGLDAIHIISHGSSGSLTLGNGILDTDDLYTHLGQVESIGKSLTEDGDILLYGCNVAAGDVGIQFITSLAQATGADVAASSNLTGAVALHGDWVLEAATGTIAPEIGISAFGYAGTLSSPITIRLPFDSEGASIAVTQEPGGSISHTGAYLYNAWDFDLSYGTPVLAVANGTVVEVRETVPDGGGIAMPDADGDTNPLNDDPSLGSGAIGNLVTIRHEVDGQTFYATYMHLQAGSVPWNINDTVSAGEVIGNVGSTGARYSESGDGTHLHFQVGSATALFGNTNYGNGTGDSAAPHTIALANQYQVGLVGFDGYGTDLPTTVIGPPAQPVVTGSVVSINDVEISEGNSGTQTLTFTVTRAGGTEAFDVNYATADGTGEVLDGDYISKAGTLHFADSQDVQTISITVNGDRKVEGDDTFHVVLSAPTNSVGVGDGFGVGRIQNDDTRLPYGYLDESFGNIGVVPIAIRVEGIAIQPNGMVIAAGSSGYWDAALVRYNPDGTLDQTFGDDGLVTSNFKWQEEEIFSDVKLDQSGKIVAVGNWNYSHSSLSQTVVARYNPDGSFDTTFGDGGYKLSTGREFSDGNTYSTTPAAPWTGAAPRFVAAEIQTDGKIVAGGSAQGFIGNEPHSLLAIARYNSDGSFDATFGGDGTVLLSPGDSPGSRYEMRSMALQADGKIIVFGESRTSWTDPGSLLLARFNLDGTLDNSFNFSGIVTLAFDGRTPSAADLIVLANGDILTIGTVYSTDSSSNNYLTDAYITRFHSDGRLDAEYGTNGSLVILHDVPSDNLVVDVQADGRIIMAISNSAPNQPFLIAQIGTDGRLDGTFGTGGVSLLPQSHGTPVDIAIATDGNIVVSSSVQNGNYYSSTGEFYKINGLEAIDLYDDYADEATDVTAPIGILTIGTSVTGTIGAADTNDTYGDKDVFKVLLNQGQSYSIHLQSTLVNGQSLPQGIFTIREGANFSTILDTSSIGSDVTENFTANKTGYHYIRVGTGAAATDQGGYQLSVTALNEWSISSVANRVGEDSGSVSFTVTRPTDVGNQTVYVSTTSREGFANQSDYTGKLDEALTFADGERTATVTVTLTADATPESNETFGLIVQESASPNLDDYLARQTFTLLNDDSAGWSIDPPSRIVNESDGSFIVSITRPEGGVTQTVYVSTLANQGSVNQGDFTALHNTPVTFIAGETVRPVRIELTDPLRSYAQDDAAIETFGIVVKQAPNDQDSTGIASATFSIADDVFQTGDPPTLDQASQIFEDAGGKVVFLAQMAEAAYHLAVHEPLGQLNDISHSEAAADERATIGQYLQFLSAADLPGLELTNVGGDFSQTGIARFDIDKTGIYTNQNAAAFVGRSEDALFIAFRGTNDVNLIGQLSAIFAGGGSPDSDHWKDHSVLNGIGVPFQDEGMAEHYALLAPLVSALDSYIANPTNGITKVYVTGHSLGGAMAQAYMDQHSGDRFQAITFASPGYEGFPDTGFDDRDSRISNLHIAFDPILLALNLGNKERGDEYLITHEGTNLSFGVHSMEAYLAVSDFIAQSNRPDPSVTSAANAVRDVVNIKLSLSQDSQGNWVADTFSGPFYGGDQGDFLFSRSGSDAIFGGGGNDFIESGDGDDSVFGEGGADDVKSGTGGGNDYYDGGNDVDTIIYTSTSRGITVNLSLAQDQGIGPEIDVDQIFNFENVIGGDGDDRITGDSMNNRLEGGSGQDAMDGGGGNDIIHGGDGNDLLNGGRGADQMEGGGGNDIYVVDHRFDQVTEVADSGLDSVSAKANHVLMDNVENLFLTGSVTVRSGGFFSRKTSTIDLSIDGTGNDTDNLLRGNRGHNQLDGLGGNDTLLGGAGADVLQGGMGADRLVGGAGADVFVFAVGDGGSSLAAADMLYDFEDGIDRIALAGGLDFANLTITQGDGTDTAAGNTVIGTSSGEYLAVLLHTSAIAITVGDFQLLGM